MFPVLIVVVLAQITSPPVFTDKGGFQKGSAAALDGASHVSADRAQVNETLVKALRAWPEAREGAKLIESGLQGAAEELFRKSNVIVGLAVTDFLAGKTEASAAGLLKLPRDLRVLPLLGESVGIAPAFARRMLEAIESIAKERPKNAEAQYYYAKALLKQDPPQVSSALERLQEAAKLDAKDTRALLELSRQYSAAARNDLAIVALEEAVRRDPKLSAAHYRLAMLYREAGKPEQSQQHLRRYQELKR